MRLEGRRLLIFVHPLILTSMFSFLVKVYVWDEIKVDHSLSLSLALFRSPKLCMDFFVFDIIRR